LDFLHRWESFAFEIAQGILQNKLYLLQPCKSPVKAPRRSQVVGQVLALKGGRALSSAQTQA